MICRYCKRPAKYLIAAHVPNPVVCGVHKRKILAMDIRVMGLAEPKPAKVSTR